MLFDWDSANIAHISRHTITPEEAEQVIENGPLDIEVQVRNGEERVLHLGATDAGRVLFVVMTKRNAKFRVVTAHPADKKARQFYAIQKDADHGQDTGNA